MSIRKYSHDKAATIDINTTRVQIETEISLEVEVIAKKMGRSYGSDPYCTKLSSVLNRLTEYVFQEIWTKLRRDLTRTCLRICSRHVVFGRVLERAFTSSREWTRDSGEQFQAALQLVVGMNKARNIAIW